jgi:serine/threonine protein kinase
LILYRIYAPVKEHYKQALGLLYLARRRDTNEQVVIKMIERGASVTRHVASELFLHRACCGHPLFVQLRDVFLTSKHMAIVMEHVPGGDVLELVNDQGGLPEDEARWLFQQVVVGLLYLHSKGAQNREIKLQNKLLSWGNNHHNEEDCADGIYTATGANTAPTNNNSNKGTTTRRGIGLLPIMTNGILSASAAAAAKENEAQSGTPMDRSPSPGPLAGVAPMGASTAALDAEADAELDSNRPGNGGGGGAVSAPHARSGRPSVKIQDFAYSKSEQINSDPHSALGSLPYTAPEVLNNTMTESCAADVWALGVALYKMVTGIYPFERPEDVKQARSAVQAVLGRIARVEYTIPDSLSPGLRDLLAHMLVRNPSERMRLNQILDHPWVKDTVADELLALNSTVDCTTAGPMSEQALRELVFEAQVNLRPLDSENVDDLADEILDEEEADELLDELSLGGYYD